MNRTGIVVVGAGAAGIAAGRRLQRAGASFVVLEARDRLGGRAHTVVREGFPLDLGCGWLHRADRNAWRELFEAEGVAIDDSPPPWGRPAVDANFPPDEQRDFRRAFGELEDRLAQAARAGPDRAASELLEPGGRWNALLDAFSAAYNGARFAQISVRDYADFEEGESDVRAPAGYGAAIAQAGRGLPVRFGAEVTRVGYGRAGVRLELRGGGAVEAEAAVVTLPTSLLDGDAVSFDPPLPGKAQAAADVPLGFAGKVFLHLDRAERDFEPESLLYGSTRDTFSASYHLRPFGRPLVESYFGGETARELEAAGADGAADFCIGQIAEALGSSFRPRLRLLAASSWSVEPASRGAYSHALPGCVEARDRLAAPEGRLLFAGEACSRCAYSSAHGAFETGEAAAEAALQVLGLL